MEVKNINFLNLDTLYQIVVEKFYDKNYNQVKFGRNLSQLLNHIVISFELSDVSEYEYIYLKMYSTHITPLVNRHFDVNYVEKNYPEVSNSIIKWMTLLSTIDMEKDPSISHFDRDSYLTPSGIIIGDCVVALSGAQLATIISLEPRDFFIKATNNKCVIVNEDPSKNKLDPEYKDKIYDDQSVDNYIIAEFINGFYKFLIEKATFIDLASDSFNIGKFLSLEDKLMVKLMTMRNPYLMCDFIEDDVKDTLNNLNLYKSHNFSKSFTQKNTYFEIRVRSSFGTFFELMNLLPYEKFICIENLNIPAVESMDIINIPECPKEWKFKYENRYNGRLKDMVTEISNKYNGIDNSAIKKLALTENYIPYSYSLLLSLEDVDIYLQKYIVENTNNSKITDYTVTSTVNMIRNIIQYMSTISDNM